MALGRASAVRYHRAVDRRLLELAGAARRLWRRAFADAPPGGALGVAFAPGRVNLIGEHVDYNDGWVLPLAVDRFVAVAYGPREDGVLRAHAAAYGQTRKAAISGLAPPRGDAGGDASGDASGDAGGDAGGDASTDAGTDAGTDRWFAYVAGVAWALREAGLVTGGREAPGACGKPPRLGADLAIVADLPRGAGLSSSAALELATARALAGLAGAPWDPLAMASLARRAEREFAGVACGAMDQIACAAAREGAALLLDCRTLAWQAVPLPASAAVVVLDSGASRALAAGAYNQRRAECARALSRLRAAVAADDPARAAGLAAWRDVSPSLLAAHRGALLDPPAAGGRGAGSPADHGDGDNGLGRDGPGNRRPGDDGLGRDGPGNGRPGGNRRPGDGRPDDGRPGDILWRRARHVVEECARPAACAAALRRDDLAAAGRLMDASHASLRDLYEVSSPELDLLTELARAHPACYGARLTGAGFGGCAVALVAAAGAADFLARVPAAYRERTGRGGGGFVCRPSAGAGLLPPG